jgi:hypothetical protein
VHRTMAGWLCTGCDFRRPVARATDPDTSHAAAVSMDTAAGVQRQQILRALAGGTANRRLVELRRAGLVERVGKTRTASGRHAWSYRLTWRDGDPAQVALPL